MSVELSVILAAGVGSRLRPLTDSVPKCLVPVAGVPILRRALELQAALGVRRAAIVTGWKHDAVAAAVAAWQLPVEIELIENAAFDTTNNEYSLYSAARVAEGRAFVLYDGDIVFERAVMDRVLAGTVTTLALRPATDMGAEEMKVIVDDAGRVTAIGKDLDPRLCAGEVPGVTRFDAHASARLFTLVRERVEQRGLRNAWYEAALAELVAAGEPMAVVDVGDAYLAEIDTLEDLARVDAEVTARQGARPAAVDRPARLP
jgi:choline kinase